MNRQTISGKIRYHTNNWVLAAIFGFACFFIVWGSWNIVTATYERIVPSSSYFEHASKPPPPVIRKSK